MNIAIFGATSEIARDLISSLAHDKSFKFTLFARKVDVVAKWLEDINLSHIHCAKGYDAFGGNNKYDAIINFVGVGDPGKASSLGSSILEITYQYDDLILSYIKKYPTCKYIFLSSGAVYGANFEGPIDECSYSKIELNSKNISDWYSMAKLYSEFRHRAHQDLSIVDLRIFNYFSSTQNMNSRFLIAEIYRSIRDGIKIKTSSSNIVRDYLSQKDFCNLVLTFLKVPFLNGAIDCYTKSPINKFKLLESLKESYGLEYEILPNSLLFSSSEKKCYYSLNRSAKLYGYEPSKNSLENILESFDRLIGNK
jgi:nucleoside-diphosphate-sugar epimerase